MAYRQPDPLTAMFNGLFEGLGSLFFGPTYNTENPLTGQLASLDNLNSTDDVMDVINNELNAAGLNTNTLPSFDVENILNLAQRHFDNPSDINIAAQLAEGLTGIRSQISTAAQERNFQGAADDYVSTVHNYINDPNSFFGQALKSAVDFRDTPAFTDQDILKFVQTGANRVAGGGNTGIKNVEASLASRGIGGSQAAADLVTSARAGLGDQLAKIKSDIALNLKGQNVAKQSTGESFVQGLSQFGNNAILGAEKFAADADIGTNFVFDPSAFQSAIRNLGADIEQTSTFNEGSLRNTFLENDAVVKDSIASFLAMTQLFGNKNSGQSSGGGGSGFNAGLDFSGMGIPVSFGGSF